MRATRTYARAYVGYTEQGVIYKECGCLCELLNRHVQGRLRAGTSGYTIRPHGSLGYRPPVPEAIMPGLQLVANPR